MAPRPCLRCGRPTNATRCPDCQRDWQRPRERARTRRKRQRRPPPTAAERQRRAETVAAWVAAHGWVCPGWQRAPHPATDLTADHIHPVGAGGAEEGPLGVLCRSCNGRKAANTP